MHFPISTHPSEAKGHCPSCVRPLKGFRRLLSPRSSAWRDGGVQLREIAILSRVNSSLLPIQVVLSEAGIPSNAPVGAKVLQRTGIRTALAYLRMGLTPGAVRREDVVQTIRRPSRGIAPNVVAMLSERSVTSVGDIRRLADRLSGRDVPKLLDYADSVDSVVVACRKSAAAALRAIRVQVGLGETMDVLDSSRREADRSTHADDLLALESVAHLHPDVATFETWLRGVLERATGRGAGSAPFDNPQDQRSRVGARRCLRRLPGAAPSPSERRRGGGTARLPRRTHTSHPPGTHLGRRR